MKYTILALTCALAGLTGCESTENLKLEPAADLNPNERKEATSLDVRFYLLKKKDNFVGAQFKALWENEKDVLKDDLIDREQITLRPGTPARHKIILTNETKYMGVVGCFLKEEEGWRVVVEKDKAGDFKYQFSGYKITLVPD